MTSDSSASGFADARLSAHARAADLLGFPWPEQLRRVRQDSAFADPSFTELSISLGRDFRLALVERQRWARLAVEAAMRARSRRAEELEPLAWAVLGTVHRVRGSLGASRTAFSRCRALRYRIADALELADTCSLEASYWYDVASWSLRGGRAGRGARHGQRALANAVELIDEALYLATPCATDTTIGLYENQAGLFASDAGRWSVAIPMLLSALDRIDPATHLRLALSAAHNLAKTAIDRGQLDAAMAGLRQLRNTYELVADPKMSLQRDWLVADVARARGHLSEAAFHYRAARDGFVVHKLPSEAARAQVEMAQLAAERGRWSEAKHLAEGALRALTAAGAPYAVLASARFIARQ